MRITQLVLFTALAVLSCALSARAATIAVGNYDLLPNTPGQFISLYVTDIVPNAGNTAAPGNVNGIGLAVAIADGGIRYGGTLGPKINSIDLDSGPTVWVPPNSPPGNIPSQEFYDGQIAYKDVLNGSGFVNVTSGLLATVEVDTTGFSSGTFPLTLSGGAVSENLGNTQFSGAFASTNIIYGYYNGAAGQITVVPEPSSVSLAAIGLIGLAVCRRKFFFPTH